VKSLLAAGALVTIVGTSQAWALGNPASAYCTSVGGRLEIRKEAAGEAGYCHLPGGRVVEEWQLFRETNKAKR
jgi:putative hemolysin